MTKKILLDIDPGIDDALAFFLALASTEIQLEALITTQGNVMLVKATRNALSVLVLAHASGSVVPPAQPLPPRTSMGKADWETPSCLSPQTKPVPHLAFYGLYGQNNSISIRI